MFMLQKLHITDIDFCVTSTSGKLFEWLCCDEYLIWKTAGTKMKGAKSADLVISNTSSSSYLTKTHSLLFYTDTFVFLPWWEVSIDASIVTLSYRVNDILFAFLDFHLDSVNIYRISLREMLWSLWGHLHPKMQKLIDTHIYLVIFFFFTFLFIYVA